MDTEKEWDTVPNKTDKIKISSNENIYLLSELIDNGACLRCLSNHCHLTEKHGIFIPDKIKIFIKNPLYISEIKKIIDNEKNIMVDINGNETSQITPIFTTCGFTHSKKGCRNCIDGRMKTLYLNKEPLIVCYSQPKPGMTKITFGIHIDIKLILKDKNYQVSAIPVNIILPENMIKMSIDTNDQFIRMDNQNDFPDLEKSEIVEKKTIVLSEKSVWNNKLKIVSEIIPIVESIPDLKIESEIIHANPISQNIQKIPSDIDFNNINLILIKENNDLKMGNNELKEQLQKLEKKINVLNEKMHKNEHIHKNAKKYEEMIKNLTTLNNIVVEQFVDTNYSEYILY